MAAKQAKGMLDDGDIFDLIGDPGAIGLIDWGNLPSWDYPLGDAGVPGGEDPYANWGGGAGGDGTDGSSDSGSNGLPAWLNQIINPNTLTGAGSVISRLLGGGGSDSGSTLGSLAGLLPLLAIGGGSLFQRNNTQQATDAMLAANTDAANLIRGQMDSGANRFLPYTDQGREAIWNMNATGARPLAQNFKPLGSGAGMNTLGKLARGR